MNHNEITSEIGGIAVRAMVAADLAVVCELWLATEGVGLTPDETPEMLAAYLKRNSGISSVAASANGEILGAVLGGHDGRRGYVYHLAVKPEHRGRGLGRKLIERTLGELAAVGIARATIFVYANNDSGRAFWEHVGWKLRADLQSMQVQLAR